MSSDEAAYTLEQKPMRDTPDPSKPNTVPNMKFWLFRDESQAKAGEWSCYTVQEGADDDVRAVCAEQGIAPLLGPFDSRAEAEKAAAAYDTN
jgi:hypothetical protein